MRCFSAFRDGDGLYHIQTKSGKEFAVGRDYKVGYRHFDIEQKYIMVTDEDGLVTLYNCHGKPMPHAQKVGRIYLRETHYEVRPMSGDTVERYPFPEHKINRLLGKLALVGAVGAVCGVGALIKGCCDKQAEFEHKTQATYLGISNGVALFDMDGNRKTAEMVVPDLTAKEIGSLYGYEKQTHSISKWREIGNMHLKQILYIRR